MKIHHKLMMGGALLIFLSIFIYNLADEDRKNINMPITEKPIISTQKESKSTNNLQLNKENINIDKQTVDNIKVKRNIYCEKIAWLDCNHIWSVNNRQKYWDEIYFCIKNSVYYPLYGWRKSCYVNLAVINNDTSLCENLFSEGIEPNLNNVDNYKYEEDEKLCIATVKEDYEYCEKTFDESGYQEAWKKGIIEKKETCKREIENKDTSYNIERISEFAGKKEEDCIMLLKRDDQEDVKKGIWCMIYLALTSDSEFEYEN